MPAGDAGEAARTTRSDNFNRIYGRNRQIAKIRKFTREPDPIRDFLGSAVRTIGTAYTHPEKRIIGSKERQDKVRSLGKAYLQDRKEAIFHPRRYSANHEQQMAISPGMLSSILKAGYATVKYNPKAGSLPEMFQGAGKTPRIYEVGNQIPREKTFGPGQEWILDRIPFITEKARRGRVYIGGLGDEHAEVLRQVPGFQTSRTPEWVQGFLSKPVAENQMRLDLGFGPIWGKDVESKAGIARLVNHVLRNYEDEAVELGELSSPFASRGLGSEGMNRLLEDLKRLRGHH